MPVPSTQVPNDLYLWSEIARNFGILIAGVLGLWIAWWRSRAANLQAQAALGQTELARRDHITELFNRAVGQLGDEKLEVRLGAIYTLRAICEDQGFKAYTTPIMETLSALVRERAAPENDDVTIDVKAIVELLLIIARMKRETDHGTPSAES
jgi:predicted secreted protein